MEAHLYKPRDGFTNSPIITAVTPSALGPMIQNTDMLHKSTETDPARIAVTGMLLTFIGTIANDDMKQTLLNIETVTEYDNLLGVETLHPRSV